MDQAKISRRAFADKVAQLNIPVCLPQELLGDSTDPTGTRQHREAYVRGETVVGEKSDRITLGPGGGFFGLVNQSLSGSVPVPHPLSPRQQALQHNHLQRLARANPLGMARFGDVEPTGRLPVTFPRDVGQLPLSYDQKRARADADVAVRRCAAPGAAPVGSGAAAIPLRDHVPDQVRDHETWRAAVLFGVFRTNLPLQQGVDLSQVASTSLHRR